jgi:type II secretory ATPase GspE/PulE/Tfp pilus assembly ATPase PilB-like protein
MDTPNSDSPLKRNSKNYFKNLGHLNQYHEFPEFKSRLTHGKNPVIVLNETKKDSLVALELHDQKFIIVSTQDEQGSANWFYLVQQGIRFNYLFEGYYTCEALTLKSFAQQIKDNRNQQTKDQKTINNAVIQNIVDTSAPIEWFRAVIKMCIELNASDIHFEVRLPVAEFRCFVAIVEHQPCLQ